MNLERRNGQRCELTTNDPCGRRLCVLINLIHFCRSCCRCCRCSCWRDGGTAMARRQFIMTRTTTRKASNIDEISAAINFHAASARSVCFRCSAPRNANDATGPVGDPSGKFNAARQRHSSPCAAPDRQNSSSTLSINEISH